jgi:hypothetical protein
MDSKTSLMNAPASAFPVASTRPDLLLFISSWQIFQYSKCFSRSDLFVGYLFGQLASLR